MTHEQIIAELTRIWHSPHLDLSLKAGLAEAIDALKGEDGDLISRQAAIKNAHFPMIDDAGYEVVRVDDILALPSAEPKTDGVLCALADRACPFQGKEYAWCLTCPHISEEDRALVKKVVAEPKTGEWLESLKREIGKAENRTLWHYAESIDKAIKALKGADGDLISRADVLEGLKHSTAYLHDDIYTIVNRIPSAEATGALDDAIAKYVADGLMELPSAEAVQVVRCKDCIRTKERDEYTGRLWCSIHRGYMEDTYYCADGLLGEDGEA